MQLFKQGSSVCYSRGLSLGQSIAVSEQMFKWQFQIQLSTYTKIEFEAAMIASLRLRELSNRSSSIQVAFDGSSTGKRAHCNLYLYSLGLHDGSYTMPAGGFPQVRQNCLSQNLIENIITIGVVTRIYFLSESWQPNTF